MVGGSKSKYFFNRNRKRPAPGTSAATSSARSTTSQKSITSFFQSKVPSQTLGTAKVENGEGTSTDCKRARLDEKLVEGLEHFRVTSEYLPDTDDSDKPFISHLTGETVKGEEPNSDAVKTNLKPTPLEKQVIDLKTRHPGMILMVECGYRYRFFGEDASIASKVLGIYCHQDKMFFTASVPTQNGPGIYVKKLIAMGHKVGIVSQTETSAAKQVSSSETGSSGLFSRALTSVFTRTTFLDESVNMNLSEAVACNPNEHIKCMVMAIYELEGHVGLCAVQPTSGEIQHQFLNEIKDLMHCLKLVQPLEIIVSTSMSKETKEVIEQFIRSDSSDHIRLEEVEDTSFSECFADDFPPVIQSLPKPVKLSFNALSNWLKLFKMESVLEKSSNISKLTEPNQVAMTLPPTTLNNLEIFQTNSPVNKVKGTLFHILNRTHTKSGARLLKDWLASPLILKSEICRRQECVEYLMKTSCVKLLQLVSAMKRMPDLDLMLVSTLYKKIKVVDFLRMCTTFSNVTGFLSGIADYERKEMPQKLQEIISEIETHLGIVENHINNLNHVGISNESFDNVFHDWSEHPTVIDKRREIAELKQSFQNHKKEVRSALKLSSFEYSSVSGLDYLIEVKQNQIGKVPDNWCKINSTKQVGRFRTPFLQKKIPQLQYLEQCLENECKKCWLVFLDQFNENFTQLQGGVGKLSELDCLFSLANVSKQEGFCCPQVFDNYEKIEIVKGRNMVLENLLPLGQQYVDNDVNLDRLNGPSTMILSGPNMGGKSSYLRGIAIIAVMAQIGCYVPAAKATLPIFDTILIRMGARDDMFNRRSTFMVELEEAASIIRTATSTSLVLIDELGRGTSTLDGCAIAKAVLKHLVTKTRCFTLFVTHYPQVSQLSEELDTLVTNAHMGFDKGSNCDNNDECRILFLFKLCPGKSSRSFGTNVAKMAGISKKVLQMAEEQSARMESCFLNYN